MRLEIGDGDGDGDGDGSGDSDAHSDKRLSSTQTLGLASRVRQTVLDSPRQSQTKLSTMHPALLHSRPRYDIRLPGWKQRIAPSWSSS